MTNQRLGVAAASLVLILVLPLAARPVAPTWGAFSGTTANSPNAFTAAASFYKAQILANGEDDPLAVELGGGLLMVHRVRL